MKGSIASRSIASRSRVPASFLLCCKTREWQFIFKILSLYDKSEEEVSSAGEQLTSNKIYDGE